MKDTVSDSFEFTKEAVPASNWFKFPKVGDSIAGTLIGKELNPGTNGFPEQIVYRLINAYINGKKVEDEDEEYKFGIATKKKFVINQLAKVKEGQIFGIKFEKLVESKSGLNPSKSFLVNILGMDKKYTATEKTAQDVFEDTNDVDVKDMPF